LRKPFDLAELSTRLQRWWGSEVHGRQPQSLPPSAPWAPTPCAGRRHRRRCLAARTPSRCSPEVAQCGRSVSALGMRRGVVVSADP
jgi:hypothetical protein